MVITAESRIIHGSRKSSSAVVTRHNAASQQEALQIHTNESDCLRNTDEKSLKAAI